MKSKWFEYKKKALAQRRSGTSLTVIEKKLGIPRSTLSGWFKDVRLTDRQQAKLMRNRRDGWVKAREKAAAAHRAAKMRRLQQANEQAQATLDRVDITDAVLDVAFAMLYLGEGSKKGTTSIASSDPTTLRFVLAVLKRNYGVAAETIRCDLHLRADQDPEHLKRYWSKELGIPLRRFKYAEVDQRTLGRPTYPDYKGVCALTCGQIAIQRKLISLYNLFCEQVASMHQGV